MPGRLHLSVTAGDVWALSLLPQTCGKRATPYPPSLIRNSIADSTAQLAASHAGCDDDLSSLSISRESVFRSLLTIPGKQEGMKPRAWV